MCPVRNARPSSSRLHEVREIAACLGFFVFYQTPMVLYTVIIYLMVRVPADRGRLAEK
jgi:hypothetical protein